MVGTRGLEPLTPTVSMWFGRFPPLSTDVDYFLVDRLSDAFEDTRMSTAVH